MKLRVKKMNQLVTLILVFVMTLSVAGCGDRSSMITDAVENESDVQSTVNSETSFAKEESNVKDNTSEAQDIVSESVESKVSEVPAKQEEASNESIVVTSAVVEDNEEEDDGLTTTMRNTINMLNYMTSLTQQVNQEKGNQLFLESAYNSFDNLYPNSVDTKTQAQITSLMDTIQDYRMISIKRDRLEYIYEQNRAKALRSAIPNPVGLLSVVQSGSLLKAAASVLYMAADSVSSYKSATSQADLQFIKDGWELDDEESAKLHSSTKDALNYMFNMVRDYDIPGDYALNKSAVEDFVSWSSKPDSDLERKISWLKTNINTYSEFGPYWLELAKDYYNYEDYEKCLDAVKHYETISTRIFRKDKDYANILPMAIISAKETMSESDYVKLAGKYCEVIHANTGDKDWTLRYFVAQIYMDLYAISNDNSYLDEAYKIVRENVVVLVDVQRKLNAKYLAPIDKKKADKDATKREKEEMKKYYDTIEKERKIALPPVCESLYLNSDLLFTLAEKRKIDATEKKKIEAILHVDGKNTFLTQALDDRFWFDKDSKIKPDDIEVTFEGDKFIIPASCVTERSTVNITVSGPQGTTTFDEWTVKEVKRPKKSTDCSEFMVTYTNKDSEKYKYEDGENVKITVTPVVESEDKTIEFTYNVVATKKAAVFNGVKFERVK